MSRVKYTLSESDIPTRWYNVLADLPGEPDPPLNPETLEPMGPEELEPLFPKACIEQEASTERWIDIPDPVNPPSGCRLHTRCPEAREVCREQQPTLTDEGGDLHGTACFMEYNEDHP
jgi:oligopeptide/dipeptide ABC transporter ATP-binding protein